MNKIFITDFLPENIEKEERAIQTNDNTIVKMSTLRLLAMKQEDNLIIRNHILFVTKTNQLLIGYFEYQCEYNESFQKLLNEEVLLGKDSISNIGISAILAAQLPIYLMDNVISFRKNEPKNEMILPLYDTESKEMHQYFIDANIMSSLSFLDDYVYHLSFAESNLIQLCKDNLNAPLNMEIIHIDTINSVEGIAKAKYNTIASHVVVSGFKEDGSKTSLDIFNTHTIDKKVKKKNVTTTIDELQKEALLRDFDYTILSTSSIAFEGDSYPKLIMRAINKDGKRIVLIFETDTSLNYEEKIAEAANIKLK